MSLRAELEIAKSNLETHNASLQDHYAKHAELQSTISKIVLSILEQENIFKQSVWEVTQGTWNGITLKALKSSKEFEGLQDLISDDDCEFEYIIKDNRLDPKHNSISIESYDNKFIIRFDVVEDALNFIEKYNLSLDINPIISSEKILSDELNQLKDLISKLRS